MMNSPLQYLDSDFVRGVRSVIPLLLELILLSPFFKRKPSPLSTSPVIRFPTAT